MSQKIKEIPMSKRFFPGLLPIVGNEKYIQVVARYQDLFEKHELPKHPALRWHLIEGILPGLAFYQVLRENGESQGSALAIIDQAFEVLFSDNFAKMKKLGRLRFIYPFLRIFIKPAMRPYPPEGWQIDWLQNDRNAIRFDMKSCFYFDTFSKYGAPELTASFCRVDDLTYGPMSTHLEWRRSKTIAGGDAHCDFCFLPVKEKPEMHGIVINGE
jgi:L-2-amino-thiazoline-4-carboxylic acid hydrolase